jgi:hypothetical protein
MMELSAIAYQQPIIRDGLSPLAGHHISREILLETSERDGFEKPLRRHPGDRRAGSRRERAGGDAWRSRRDEKLRARPAIYNTDLASAPRELVKALKRTFPGVVTLALGAFTIPRDETSRSYSRGAHFEVGERGTSGCRQSTK